MIAAPFFYFFFFFNDTATTEIYTLSLHDALPIFLVHDAAPGGVEQISAGLHQRQFFSSDEAAGLWRDRKSTRLNSSHQIISYAVFCLKKKKNSKRGAKHDDVACPAGTRRPRALTR